MIRILISKNFTYRCLHRSKCDYKESAITSYKLSGNKSPFFYYRENSYTVDINIFRCRKTFTLLLLAIMHY